VERYDAVIFSTNEYAQQLLIPQILKLPAIDPFSSKNRELSEDNMRERLAHYDIPTDLPLVVQVSRFDLWKDPKGVIEAFKIARQQVPATLVLLGNFASDDPEGAPIYESLLKSREERILILPNGDDTALVNTLQRKAVVVLQKSLREGFGLTVTEAMWKATPVIGGNVGGIRYQIEDGVNGIQPQCVKVKLRLAVERVLNEVTAHLVAVRPVEVQRLTPGRVVAVREVGSELIEAVAFGAEMVVNHIERNGRTRSRSRQVLGRADSSSFLAAFAPAGGGDPPTTQCWDCRVRGHSNRVQMPGCSLDA
jgi:trehalose synthase